jgi:hypothetical protein
MVTRRKGIGLLEIMLIIVVIVGVSMMVTKYYLNSQEQSRVLKAIDMLSDVTSSSYQWVATQNNNFTNISIASLISGGYLPQGYGAGKNPWHGDVKVDPISSGASVQITFTNVPTTSCILLKNSTAKLAPIKQDCQDATFTISFAAP